MPSPSTRRADPIPLPGLAGKEPWWRYWFEEAEDAQLLCDRESLILEANRRAADQLGLAPGTRLLSSCLFATPAITRLQEAFASPSRDPKTLTGISVTCPNGA